MRRSFWAIARVFIPKLIFYVLDFVTLAGMVTLTFLLDLWRKVSNKFLCTPWNTIYLFSKYEVIPPIGLGGV